MAKKRGRPKKSILSHYMKDELRSIATTTLSIIVVDGAVELMNIYNGDFSQATLWALLLIIARSTVKAVLTLVFPSVFPVRKSQKKQKKFA